MNPFAAAVTPPPSPPRRALRAAAGVVLQCAVYGTDPAAQEGRALAAGLARAGLPLRLAPLDQPLAGRGALPPALADELERLRHGPLDLARSVLYYAGDPLHWNLDVRGRCRVGRVSWATDRLPRAWREPCQALDELWVSSEFQRRALAASGIPEGQLRVLSPGVDTALFRPEAPRLEIPAAKGFRFLAVTNLRDRQGGELLLEALLQEFRAEEDVALLLKVAPHAETPGDTLEAELAFFIERRCGLPLERGAQVLLMDQNLSPPALASLYASVDAFVRPAFGTGHGQALREALSSGLPVVATRWGGALDFLRDHNSYLVDLEGLVPASTENELVAGHSWARPSREHLRQRLREVFTQCAEARARGQRARREMVESADWTTVLPRWERAFRELLSGDASATARGMRGPTESEPRRDLP